MFNCIGVFQYFISVSYKLLFRHERFAGIFSFFFLFCHNPSILPQFAYTIATETGTVSLPDPVNRFEIKREFRMRRLFLL